VVPSWVTDLQVNSFLFTLSSVHSGVSSPQHDGDVIRCSFGDRAVRDGSVVLQPGCDVSDAVGSVVNG
jgi:hypothetical protein